MTSKELLTFLFSKLDDSFINSLYFQELKKIVFEYCCDYFDQISVSSFLYEELPFCDFPVEVGDTILEFESGPIYLNIVQEGGVFIVELRLTKDDALTSTLATIGDFSRIETSVITLEDLSYASYDNKVYYYSKNEVTPIEIKGEEDYNFAKEFHIPLRLARFFRLYFKKMGNLFNRYAITENFNAFETFLDDEDYYAFIGPFATSSFIGFIKGYCFSHINANLLEIFIEDGRFDDIIEERESILEAIVSFLGSDGECVISYSFYQAILLYLTGLISSLNIKGFILKCVNGIYLLYCVTFRDNECYYEAYEVADEQVKSMYQLNSFNKENETLTSFFGMGHGR